METNKNEQNFMLIGAGLPRTGTMSLKLALEIILPGKCHHMIDAMQFHEEVWRDIFNGTMSDDEFRHFFATNYAAAVDAPFCTQYEKAMKVFPNAKVLLSVRDPEGWVESVKATILDAFDFDFPYTIFGFLGLFSSYIGRRPHIIMDAFGSTEFDINLKKEIRAGRGVAFYENWVRSVEENVPKEKLLKFSVKEGWGPLCKFLDVPVPDVPLPHCNATRQFTDRVETRRRRSWLLLYEMISLPVLAYLCYRMR